MGNVVSGTMRPGWPYFTSEEVRRIIDEDLADLKDVPALEITTKFSQNLVPLPKHVPAPKPVAAQASKRKQRIKQPTRTPRTAGCGIAV